MTMIRIRELLAVGFGCAAGAVVRMLLGVWLDGAMIDALAICIVNLLGCLLMGVLTSLIEVRQPDVVWAKAMTTGLCGGLTTFSTFCGDAVQLFATSPLLSLGIMFVSLAGGMALYVAGRHMIRPPRRKDE